MINYHMTHISTNNKYLKPGISLKYDQLQKAPLTQSRSHDTFSSKILSMSNPTPTHFLNFPLAAKLQRPPFQPSHWSMKCMAHYNFPLLIIIPGIHSLACLAMTRALIIYLKPCLILLKFIFFTNCYTVSIFFTILPCSYLIHFMQRFIELEVNLC